MIKLQGEIDKYTIIMGDFNILCFFIISYWLCCNSFPPSLHSSLHIPSLPCSLPHWSPSMWSPFLWFCSCSICLLSFCFCFLGSLLIVVSLLLFTVYCFWSSISQISPLKISYNKGLVMMNSFNLTLSGKHFICLSILNDNFAG